MEFKYHANILIVTFLLLTLSKRKMTHLKRKPSKNLNKTFKHMIRIIELKSQL